LTRTKVLTALGTKIALFIRTGGEHDKMIMHKIPCKNYDLKQGEPSADEVLHEGLK
jgi:hypothetical protein